MLFILDFIPSSQKPYEARANFLSYEMWTMKLVEGESLAKVSDRAGKPNPRAPLASTTFLFGGGSEEGLQSKARSEKPSGSGAISLKTSWVGG